MATTLIDKVRRPGRIKRDLAAVGGRGEGFLAEDGLNNEAMVAPADEGLDLLRGQELPLRSLCSWVWCPGGVV